MENDNKRNAITVNNVQEECVSDDDDVFHFETEHLALRGNQCYSNLLRTIAMLQAQRIRVHQQIDELQKARDLYLDNPQLLLEKLRQNEPLIAPNYLSTIRLPELPTLTIKEEVKVETPSEQPLEEDHKDNKDTRNGSKTQGRLWTNEEQLRLEQLLIEYPPEEVEMRRFSKIAKALGNRTAQQVFSRIQKYFQKLHDAGMPVPGRLPKYRRAGGPSRPKFSLRRSTFFPAQNIEIQMPEDEYTLDELMPVVPSPPLPIKSEPKLEADASEAETRRRKQMQLNILTSIQEEKLQTEDGYSPDPLAPRCAQCEESAVTRTRWRCNSCYCPLNLCGDCLAHQLITESFEHMTHDVAVDQEI